MGSTGTDVVVDMAGTHFDLDVFESFIRDVFHASGADTGVLWMSPRTREVVDRAYTTVEPVGDDDRTDFVKITLRSGAYAIAESDRFEDGRIEAEINGRPFGLLRNFTPSPGETW